MREANHADGCGEEISTDIQTSLLIGANIDGKIFTGKREQIEYGLVVMKTVLRWTIMGKLTDEGSDSYLSKIVTFMFVKEAYVSEL